MGVMISANEVAPRSYYLKEISSIYWIWGIRTALILIALLIIFMFFYSGRNKDK